jgi:hypothetical protein
MALQASIDRLLRGCADICGLLMQELDALEFELPEPLSSTSVAR